MSGGLSVALIGSILSIVAGDGFEFLKNGKPGYARTAFRNQLKRDPEDLESRFGLGLSELALGNAEAAVENLLRVAERKGRDALLRRALAEALLLKAKNRIATGRDDEHARWLLMDAGEQARLAAELDPKSWEPWRIRAKAALERSDVDEARTALKAALERGLPGIQKDELEGEIAYFSVVNAMESGEGEEDLVRAQRSLEELLRRNPRSVELWLRLGDLHYNAGRLDPALDCYRESLLIDPFQRVCLEYLLADLANPELLPKIESVVDAALKKASDLFPENDPRRGFLLYCTAQTRIAARLYRESIPYLTQALQVDPSLAIVCELGIGDAQFRENNHSESCRAYLQAIRQSFDEVVAQLRHLNRGEAVAPCLVFHSSEQFKAGHKAEARDLLAVAVEFAPDDASALNNYAFLCRETGKYEESYRAYSILISRSPDNPRFLNDCALVLHYHLRRDLDRAEALYLRAIDAARRLLESPESVPAIRDSASSALKDAEENLARLRRERGGQGGRPPSRKGTLSF